MPYSQIGNGFPAGGCSLPFAPPWGWRSPRDSTAETRTPPALFLRQQEARPPGARPHERALGRGPLVLTRARFIGAASMLHL